VTIAVSSAGSSSKATEDSAVCCWLMEVIGPLPGADLLPASHAG